MAGYVRMRSSFTAVRRLAILAVSIALGPSAGAVAAAASGQYDALTIAVVGNHVSGAFSDHRGEDGPGGGPQFVCAFRLDGTLVGSRAEILTQTPGDKTKIAGELVFDGDRVTLQLQDDQDGCAMTSGDMVRKPYELSKILDGKDWLDVTMVAGRRAVLRRAPAAPTSRRPYVVAFNPVAILHRSGAWVRIAYLAGGAPVTGWVRAAELIP